VAVAGPAVPTIETSQWVLAGEIEAGMAAAEDLWLKHRMVASTFRIFFQRAAISC